MLALLSSVAHLATDFEYEWESSSNLSPEATMILCCCSAVFGLVMYLIYAFAQYKIAKKVNDESPWWAWVPVLNGLQQLRMGDQNMWLYLLVFVPCLDIVAFVYSIIAWVKILEKLGKPGWYVILIILVPFFVLFLAM